MKFYPNCKDDLHCFQVCLRMALSEFFPKEKYTYRELDMATGFSKTKFTWDAQGLLWIARKGIRVTCISEFDYHRFASEGEAYLRWYWRPDVFEFQKKNSDIVAARKAVQKLLPRAEFFCKRATLKDIREQLKSGGIVLASVNPKALDEKEGYSKHMVVVLSIDKQGVTFHDPGIPPEPFRKVKNVLFKKALFDIIVLRSNK